MQRLQQTVVQRLQQTVDRLCSELLLILGSKQTLLQSCLMGGWQRFIYVYTYLQAISIAIFNPVTDSFIVFHVASLSAAPAYMEQTKS